MSATHAKVLALIVAGLVGASSARAADRSPGQARTTEFEALQAGAGVAAASTPTRLSPVADSDLAALAGGREVLAMTEQTLTAVNTGNAVNADTVNTGAVSLNANAFSGFSGIGNFVINTGNNNNLQGSLSVNIVMAPGG